MGNFAAYVHMSWRVFFHPVQTIAGRTSTNDANTLLPPETFFVLNVIIAAIVGHWLGYKMPVIDLDVPDSLDWLNGPYTLFVRFILGVSTLTFLLARGWVSPIRQLMPQMLRVYCYSSVVFIPVVFVKSWSGTAYGTFLLDLVSNVFAGNLQALNGSFIARSAASLGMSLLLGVFVFVWWCYLMYVGVSSLKERPRGRVFSKLIGSVAGFFILKLLVVTPLHWYWTYKEFFSAWQIINVQLPESLGNHPPQYLKASILCSEVGRTSKIPPSIRYAAKLRSFVYKLAAVPTSDRDIEQSIREILDSVEKRDYDNTRELLERIVSSELREDRRFAVATVDGQTLLVEANELRRSPTYTPIGLKGEYIEFFFPAPPSPMAIWP